MIKRRLFSAAAFAVTLGWLSLGSQASNTIHGATQTAVATTSTISDISELSIARRQATAAGITGTQSALSDDLLPPDDGKALIRFAHAAPDAPTVDVLVDGSTLASGLGFGDSVDYKAVAAGTHHVALQVGGKTTFETDITLPGKAAFTAVAQGLLEAKDKRAFTVAFYKDDVSETNYRVRLSVIHAVSADLKVSDENSPVDLVWLDLASGKVIDRLYKNLKYGQITPGFQLDKGSYRYGLQAPSDQKNIFGDVTLTTETGMVYTVIVAGNAGNPKTEMKTLVLSTKGLRYYPTAVPGTLAVPAIMGGATLPATTAP
jgi:hypothetical protein